eukprot:1188748-Prorocentrum_minimum.AAC.2
MGVHARYPTQERVAFGDGGADGKSDELLPYDRPHTRQKAVHDGEENARELLEPNKSAADELPEPLGGNPEREAEDAEAVEHSGASALALRVKQVNGHIPGGYGERKREDSRSIVPDGDL